MSTLAVPSDMVATMRSTTQRPSEPFEQTKKWCWRDGSAGGEEWNKAVHDAAEALEVDASPGAAGAGFLASSFGFETAPPIPPSATVEPS